ncbi:MAG: RdgB/HAM1 family non-canonical purine NTP pyrophosphatase [Bacteroides sp.]|nr:RdgB/HAM1 family non-canonical purine NTP pyrophosphatase [Bacteroides sp.]MCM1086276.1 RdgB/HAM1 family non-canonical purine NTP pyrophosphatase [Bacteroides sp.]
MKTLYIATHNAHKTQEIRSLFERTPALAERYTLGNLESLGFSEDIPETADTLEGNALQKARFIHEKYGVDCFADDTGLEVPALGNRPGIYSARYANMPQSFEQDGLATPETLALPDPTFDQNIDRLLQKLQGKPRAARFRTVICLILDGQTHYFEGSVEGEILSERQGAQGFGYDPVFRPEGFPESFAGLDVEEKNRISHRGRAVQKLMEFLEKA